MCVCLTVRVRVCPALQSLLRSPKSPDDQCDMGLHCFTFALLPHSGPPACVCACVRARVCVPSECVFVCVRAQVASLSLMWCVLASR